MCERASKRPREGTRSARGYTAVEVLMAMTVMSIGAAAVMSMQRASIQGNLDARKTDIANSIARTWVERLERDAMQWTSPGPTNGSTSNMSTTALVLNAGLTTNAGLWFLPNQYISNSPPFSPAFDILGRDLPQSAIGTELFCVGVRLSWLVVPATGVAGLIRADVRVLWPRGITGIPSGGVCPQVTAADSSPPNPLNYHSIYVSTALQGNPQ
jgi:prepilin-type N-terminal cleavage/methylation domain-containing protein